MPTLLLIEDEENERLTLQRVLERSGFEVHAVGAAPDARSAMDDTRYDGVLSDVFMPGGDGLSFAREIAERCPGVPIVLMSAFPFSVRQVERMEIPRLRFVSKPLDLEVLLDLLRNPDACTSAAAVSLPSMRRRSLSPR